MLWQKKKNFFEKFTAVPPKKDLTFSELETLLNYYSFKKIEGNGSRVKFIHPSKQLIFSIHKPHPSNILKEYVVKEVQALLKGLEYGNA